MAFQNVAYFLIQDYIIGFETKIYCGYCAVRNEVSNIIVADFYL